MLSIIIIPIIVRLAGYHLPLYPSSHAQTNTKNLPSIFLFRTANLTLFTDRYVVDFCDTRLAVHITVDRM